MDGWVKLYRKILDNPVICKDGDYLAVWIYLLLKATHKEVPKVFKGEKIILKQGQLITGRKVISEKLSIQESKVTRIINSFIFEQQIEQETSNQNRLITILNWHLYQESEQQLEQPMNNERTTDEQPVNTNKNERKKEYKEDINTYVKISELYNSICLSYPRLTKLSEKRKKTIKARMNTYTVEDFKALFELAESSPFLKGKNNRNWSATFDWLIADANMAKVLDGNYNKEKEQTNGTKPVPREPNLSYAEQLLASGYIPKDHGENPFG